MRGAAAFSPRKFIALFFSCDDITCSPSVINAREHCNLLGMLAQQNIHFNQNYSLSITIL
jgi:hypothetical protein